MAVDVSFLSYISPIIIFLFVAGLVSALLVKFELLGKNTWLSVFMGIFIALIFLTAGQLRNYVLTIVPWFATILIVLFFVLLLVSFAGKDASFLNKPIGVVFVIALIFVFIVSGIIIFSGSISPYLPWSSGYGGEQNILRITDWIYSPPVMGAILLVIAAILVAWLLVKGK